MICINRSYYFDLYFEKPLDTPPVYPIIRYLLTPKCSWHVLHNDKSLLSTPVGQFWDPKSAVSFQRWVRQSSTNEPVRFNETFQLILEQVFFILYSLILNLENRMRRRFALLNILMTLTLWSFDLMLHS